MVSEKEGDNSGRLERHGVMGMINLPLLRSGGLRSVNVTTTSQILLLTLHYKRNHFNNTLNLHI